MRTVLIVDDDSAVRTLIAALLERHQYSYDFASNGNEAIAKLRRRAYDVVVLDLMMPVATGFDVVQYLRCEKKDMLQRTIVVTAASTRTLDHFDESLVGGVLRKPFDIDRLIAMVGACAEAHSNSER